MVEELILVNETTEEKILMNREESLFLLDDDGISWGSVDSSNDSYTSHDQIGENIVSTTLKPRDVTIVGYVWANMHQSEEIYSNISESKFLELMQESINESKKILSRVINPLSFVRIEVGDFYISGKPSSSVEFSDEMVENNEIKCKFLISIECNKPLFKKKAIEAEVLSGVKGNFHFPLVMKKDIGFIIGERTSYRILTVENNGDIKIGGVISISSSGGDILNPEITNIYNGQVLRINKTLQSGEVIILDTVEKEIYGIIGNEILNYSKYLYFESDWIDFEVGENLIGYSADNESYQNMSIQVSINEQFYSLGEQ